MGRVTTKLGTTLTLAVLAGAGCRDAAGPVEAPPDRPAFILDGVLPTVLTGDIVVTTATSGSSLDADGYTITVDLLQSRAIAPNGSVRYTVLTGAHTVAVSGVASNCEVSGSSTRVVTVLLGGAAPVRFDVSCRGPSPPPPPEPPPPEPPPPAGGTRVTGGGAMGPGTATAGSDRFEFDFEATSAPNGRMAVTDYSVVRGDGSVGRMSVNPAADPATGVTSFSRTSTACVRFGGTGRLDTGETWEFFVDACDNGSPGAGSDTFTITLPDRGGPGVPFTRSGTLTEGNIVIASGTS